MVQPNKEVLHCGATLKNGEGTPSDNFDRLIHYAKHLPQLPSSSSRCKNDTRRRWVCRLLKMKELPPLIVATDVPENGESGDRKQSQESCICHADILAFHRERRALEESAAILIQAAFRGYLARKALRALKGVVKLQALIRGWAVRQQAINTLKCLQSIVNIQSEVFSKRCDRIKALHNQDYKSQDVCEKDIKVDSNSQKRWDDSILTKEELKALFLTRRDASIKRERAREYYLNHRRSAETERDKAYGRRRYWLEQWVDSQLAKNENPGNSDRVSSANPRYRDEIGGRLRNFQKQYQADISESPTSAPRRTYHHRKQRSTGDESSFLGSPSVPAYMASTESAKAKARSLSSPRLRPLSFDVCSEIASPYKQKLSPISSINSELTSSSWIGNHIGSSQRSPRLRGSPGPIKSSMSAKDVRIRGILYQNGVSVAPIDGACTMGNKL